MANQSKNAPLTDFERKVILEKGTEQPFTGRFNSHFEAGVYQCRSCGQDLYHSDSKFRSGCGWPSFDDEIKGAVKRLPDADGRRIEIVCHKCDGHLGHVFEGEGYTPKNTRHCVNSVSIVFKPQKVATQKAIFASGCFWGTEYYFAKVPGVLQTTVGYSGGNVENPSYESVCSGTTGHLECVEVEYDPRRTDFEILTKVFFETHDFTQINGQGPDIGSQYLSAVFVLDAEQRQITEGLIKELHAKGHEVATKVMDPATFYPAETYHQDYYYKNSSTPYCHIYRPIWEGEHGKALKG